MQIKSRQYKDDDGHPGHDLMWYVRTNKASSPLEDTYKACPRSGPGRKRFDFAWSDTIQCAIQINKNGTVRQGQNRMTLKYWITEAQASSAEARGDDE